MEFSALKNKDGWLGFEWNYTLKREDRRMSGVYTMGTGHMELLGGLGDKVKHELPTGVGFSLDTAHGIVFKVPKNGKNYLVLDMKHEGSGRYKMPSGGDRFAWKGVRTLSWQSDIFFQATAPKAHDILLSLVFDTQGVYPIRAFEDWAGDYGYDADSIKALDIFRACQEEAVKLRAFLGAKFDELLTLDCEEEVIDEDN